MNSEGTVEAVGRQKRSGIRIGFRSDVAVYVNEAGQTVNPFTGRTLPASDPSTYLFQPEAVMSKIVQELRDLVGEEISAVCFVRDYVEFHFDGPVLRSLTNPIVVDHGARHLFPEPGSRDALCRLIGSTVRGLEMEEARALTLTTADEREIWIPLDAKSRRGPEAMEFLPQGVRSIQVW